LDLKGLQPRAQQQSTIHPNTDFIESVLYLCKEQKVRQMQHLV